MANMKQQVEPRPVDEMTAGRQPRPATDGASEVDAFAPEDYEIFARMNRMTKAEADRAADEGRKLFEQATRK